VRTSQWRIARMIMACLAIVWTPAPAGAATVRERAARVEPAAVRKVKLPPVGARPDYQLGGAYAPSGKVRIVTRDRSAVPAKGRYGICYVNAYQTQVGEEDQWVGANADLVLRDAAGRPVVDADWGEQLLDTSTASKRGRLAAIVGGWIAGCARAGYSAVEPDNLDSWTRSRSLLTKSDNLAFARLLVARAHKAGLAIAQKNAAEVTKQGHAIGFDFAVAEECQVWKECGSYTRYYGRHVIEIEYNDQPLAAFTKACRLRGRTISIVRRDRDLVAKGQPGYYARWC
jgi:hypothetical protein